MLLPKTRNINEYERLLHHAFANDVFVFEKSMPTTLKGLYADGFICINKDLPSTVDKLCVLAEELGHHHTTTGNILDQRDISNRKQELRARHWAYKHLMPLEKLIEAAHALGETNKYELAEFLNVTEEFLDEALKCFENKLGTSVCVDGYIINFSPLRVHKKNT